MATEMEEAKLAEELLLVKTALITAHQYVGPLKVERWKAYCWMLDQALRSNFATVVIR